MSTIQVMGLCIVIVSGICLFILGYIIGKMDGREAEKKDSSK